jgi:hypothetical protein
MLTPLTLITANSEGFERAFFMSLFSRSTAGATWRFSLKRMRAGAAEPPQATNFPVVPHNLCRLSSDIRGGDLGKIAF